MNIDQMTPAGDMEQEFMAEDKSEGSLAPHLVADAGNFSPGENSYLGYDIHPENIEALYFDGIGIPRWESITGGKDLDEHTALYMEQFNKRMADFPMIGRVSDTDQKVDYSRDDLIKLAEECSTVISGTSDPKAIRAAQKLSLACAKAAGGNMALTLIPS